MTQSAEKGPRVPEFDLLHARLEEYEQAFLQDAFEAAFQPDFGGVDWRDDAAIQQFARAATATLYTRVTPPVECDNYLPPLTCLTAPSSESGRCDKCAERGQADA